MATHPQLTMGAGEDLPARSLAEVHRVRERPARASGAVDRPPGQWRPARDEELTQFVDRMRLLWEGQDAMILKRDLGHLRGCAQSGAARTRTIRPRQQPLDRVFAQGQAFLAGYHPESVQLWGGEVFLFPNFFYLPDVQQCALLSDPALSTTIRSGAASRCGHSPCRRTARRFPRPTPGPLRSDDVDNWGRIPRQDFSNHARQQRGLHSPRISPPSPGYRMGAGHQQHARGARQVSRRLTQAKRHVVG